MMLTSPQLLPSTCFACPQEFISVYIMPLLLLLVDDVPLFFFYSLSPPDFIYIYIYYINADQKPRNNKMRGRKDQCNELYEFEKNDNKI